MGRGAPGCPKASLLPADNFRARAGGLLVDAVARLLVLGHAQLLHAAVGSGVLAGDLGRTDQALAGLVAGRAVRELRVRDTLLHLEAATTALAMDRGRRVVVERHAAFYRWRGIWQAGESGWGGSPRARSVSGCAARTAISSRTRWCASPRRAAAWRRRARRATSRRSGPPRRRCAPAWRASSPWRNAIRSSRRTRTSCSYRRASPAWRTRSPTGASSTTRR